MSVGGIGKLQTPQHYDMMKQQKITSYGVRPVESLAGMAPGPVPRMDPPPTTGQTKLNANIVNGKKKVGQNNQKSKQGNGQKFLHQSLNILQFNIDGFSNKKQNLPISLTKMISTLLFYRKPRKGNLQISISPTTLLPTVTARNVKEPSHT